LEAKRFERVGDVHPIHVDVRIIAATNKNLQQLIQLGQFREDLLFRINVITIQLPPLREKTDDIPLLVQHFVERLRLKTSKAIEGVSPEAMECLIAYRWPGNVRELKGVMEFAFVVAERGLIQPSHLPVGLKSCKMLLSQTCATDPESQDGKEEREALVAALNRANGNKSKAAAILGVNRNTILNRMRKYGINLRKTIVT
jgi:transcriptional regulator with PAS, ATPase and Fis domain